MGCSALEDYRAPSRGNQEAPRGDAFCNVAQPAPQRCCYWYDKLLLLLYAMASKAYIGVSKDGMGGGGWVCLRDRSNK